MLNPVLRHSLRNELNVVVLKPGPAFSEDSKKILIYHGEQNQVCTFYGFYV